MIDIFIYETDAGKRPFNDWFGELDKANKVKVSKRLIRIRTAGNYGDNKQLGDSLFELRFSNGIRIYFSKFKSAVVLLLCGGSKNNKGEQSRDIEKARKFLKDFEGRINGKEFAEL